MQTKRYAVLLCALLASTFVHETLTRQVLTARAQQIAAKAARPAPRIASGLVKRSSDSNGLSCGYNTGGSAPQFYVQNGTAYCFSEPSSNMTGFFDESSGILIIIDLSASTYCSQSSSVDSIKSSSLKSLWDSDSAQSTSSASSTDRANLSAIIKLCSSSIGFVASVDTSKVFALVIKISILLTNAVDELDELLEALLTTVVDVVGDLDSLVNKLLGLKSIFVSLDVSSLVSAGLSLDLSALFGSSNPEYCMSLVVSSLKSIVDFASVDVFITLASIAKVLSLLGGKVNIYSSVHELISSINNGNLSMVESVKYCSVRALSGDSEANFNTSLSSIISDLEENVSLYGSNALSDVVSDLDNLVNEVLVVGGVSISEIIKILKPVISDVLSILVSVCVSLAGSDFSTDLCYSTLFYNVLVILNSLPLYAKYLLLSLDISVSDSKIVGGLSSLIGTLSSVLKTLLGIVGGVISMPLKLVKSLLDGTALNVLISNTNFVSKLSSKWSTAISNVSGASWSDCLNSDNEANTNIRNLMYSCYVGISS